MTGSASGGDQVEFGGVLLGTVDLFCAALRMQRRMLDVAHPGEHPSALPTLRATLEAELGPLAEYQVAENVVQFPMAAAGVNLQLGNTFKKCYMMQATR